MGIWMECFFKNQYKSPKVINDEIAEERARPACLRNCMKKILIQIFIVKETILTLRGVFVSLNA
jgi:hypothetical protein